jgi:predicted alpha/beta hydrolase
MKLSQVIKDITSPIFYIHAHDDKLAPFEKVKTLAKKTPDAHHWWIKKPSTHACHHLKHTYAYQKKMMEFINKQLHNQNKSFPKN